MAELYFCRSDTGWQSIECLLSSFEDARPSPDYSDIRNFMPSKDHPDYSQIVSELIRIDLEYAWSQGETRQISWYELLIPGIFHDSSIKSAASFEVQRLQEIYKNEKISGHSGPVQSTHFFQNKSRNTFQPLNPGDTIGEFEIIKSLGHGAFGQVYLARAMNHKNRKLVLKFTAVAQIEFQILRSLHHANIMPVLEYEATRQFQAIAMPYLGELTLMNFIYREEPGSYSNIELSKKIEFDNPLELNRLKYKWISKIASAVGHIHENGYIHRDLKPANILISFHNEPILLDFNMAIKADRQHIRHTGGTLAYMAPEQLCERRGLLPEATFSTDIYSLGVIILELLTGEQAFPTHTGDMRKVIPQMRNDRQKLRLQEHVSANARHDIPSQVLQRCLAPDPRQRYRSATELLSDLDIFLNSHPDLLAEKDYHHNSP